MLCWTYCVYFIRLFTGDQPGAEIWSGNWDNEEMYVTPFTWSYLPHYESPITCQVATSKLLAFLPLIMEYFLGLCKCLTLIYGFLFIAFENNTVNAGSNKHPTTTLNSAKLDREEEVLKHKTVDLDTGKLIAQARQAKGFTQKDLATVRIRMLGLDGSLASSYDIWT